PPLTYTPPRRPRRPLPPPPLETNHSPTGIPVLKNSLPLIATMQSTNPASTSLRRISPSPRLFEDNDPLASTKPAVPLGARWWMKCWTHAKFALPGGGVPYFQRGSSPSFASHQSDMLNGGFAIT